MSNLATRIGQEINAVRAEAGPVATSTEVLEGTSNEIRRLTPALLKAAVDAGGSDLYQPGDVVETARELSAPTWLKMNGATYSRSSYPDLGAVYPSLLTGSDITSVSGTSESNRYCSGVTRTNSGRYIYTLIRNTYSAKNFYTDDNFATVNTLTINAIKGNSPIVVQESTGYLFVLVEDIGIMRSTNEGDSWTTVFSDTTVNSSTYTDQARTFIAEDGTIYISSYSSAQLKVFKISTNGTATVSNSFNAGSSSVSVAATGNTVLVGVVSGLWRSTDGGSSFSDISTNVTGSVESSGYYFVDYIRSSGLFVCNVDGLFYTSPDGVVWTAKYVPYLDKFDNLYRGLSMSYYPELDLIFIGLYGNSTEWAIFDGELNHVFTPVTQGSTLSISSWNYTNACGDYVFVGGAASQDLRKIDAELVDMYLPASVYPGVNKYIYTGEV